MSHKNDLKKEWWIQVKGKKQGPFTLAALKDHPYFNPDALVWKEGFPDWIAARYVEELEPLFEDEEEAKPLLPKPPADIDFGEPAGPLAISSRQDPPPFFIWIVIVFLLLFFILLNIKP